MTKFQLAPVKFSCSCASSVVQKPMTMSFMKRFLYVNNAIHGPIALFLSYDLIQSLSASEPHLETEVTSLLYKEVVEKNL